MASGSGGGGEGRSAVRRLCGGRETRPARRRTRWERRSGVRPGRKREREAAVGGGEAERWERSAATKR
jgi:hypothetical protein